MDQSARFVGEDARGKQIALDRASLVEGQGEGCFDGESRGIRSGAAGRISLDSLAVLGTSLEGLVSIAQPVGKRTGAACSTLIRQFQREVDCLCDESLTITFDEP